MKIIFKYFMSTIVVFAAWFIFSGMSEPFFIFSGIISSVLVILICNQLSLFDIEKYYIIRPSNIKYLLWLIKEIFISSLSLSFKFFTKDILIEESAEILSIPESNELTKMIYANSITLTPGTITIDLKEDKFLIHSLDSSNIKSLDSQKMFNKVKENV